MGKITQGNYLGIEFNDIPVDEIKEIMRYEIKILETKALEIGKKVKEAIKDWPPEKKGAFSDIVFVLINDEITKKFPELYGERLEANKGKYQKELYQLNERENLLINNVSQKFAAMTNDLLKGF